MPGHRTSERVVEILRHLVSFPTVCGHSNLELIDWIAAYLSEHGVAAAVIASPDGTKANLYATIGPAVSGGVVLSGHTDVVPAGGDDDWLSDPFALAEREGRLYARGAADMKGFLAATLALVPFFREMPLRTPIHLAFSYDEELGCQGVPDLISFMRDHIPPPAIAFVGEPTGMRVINEHKGFRAFRTIARGQAAHSSTPALGFSAIKMAGAVIAALSEVERIFAERGPSSCSRLLPPHTTVNIGTIHGGTAVNIVPAEVAIEWEFRPAPGEEADSVLTLFRERLALKMPAGMEAARVLAAIDTVQTAMEPAFELCSSSKAETLALRLTGESQCAAFSAGTEAGFFQNAGVSAVVIGPGNIEQAHQPNEFIARSDLGCAERFLHDLCRWARQHRAEEL